MQEDRPGRDMRRTRDEHRRRPTCRSRERASGQSRRQAQAAQSSEVSELTLMIAWLADDRPRPQFDYVATAEACKNFLRHIFPPAPHDRSRCAAPASSKPSVANADEFIVALLRRIRFPEYIAFAALFLLHRLRHSGVPLDAGSASVLFLAAYMISAKVYEDTTFSHSSWVVLGSYIADKGELDRWERDICSLLHWNLLVDPGVLNEFAKAVKRDFRGDGPYPDYRLDEDLSAPENCFPQLPGNPIDEDEEEPLFSMPAAIPPPSVLAALSRHKRLSQVLPPLSIEHRMTITACEGSATMHARSKAGPCFDRPSSPTAWWGPSATWMPPVVLRVPGHVLSNCKPV